MARRAICATSCCTNSWGHNVRILDYVKDPGGREWDVRATLQHGWSRDVLVHQIESGLHKRTGAAVTNFERTLPPPQSDLAQQIKRDPYTFDFLMLAEDAHERELEQGLLVHLREFLLELGIGFAFVGSQYRLDVGGNDFLIDLLFYHLKLRCFVVIDLKAKVFEPEFAGKMNFYLDAVDDFAATPGRSAEHRPDHLQGERLSRGGIRSQKYDDAHRNFRIHIVGIATGRFEGKFAHH